MVTTDDMLDGLARGSANLAAIATTLHRNRRNAKLVNQTLDALRTINDLLPDYERVWPDWANDEMA